MYAKTKQFNPTTQLGGLWQKKGGNILCSLLSVRPGCLEPSAAQGHLGFVPPFGYLTRCFRTCSQIFPLEEFPLGGLTLSNLLIKLKNIRLGAVGSNSLLVVQQLMGSVSDTATTQSSWHSAGTPSSAGLCWALLVQLVQELMFDSLFPAVAGRAPGRAVHPELGVDSLEAMMPWQHEQWGWCSSHVKIFTWGNQVRPLIWIL